MPADHVVMVEENKWVTVMLRDHPDNGSLMVNDPTCKKHRRKSILSRGLSHVLNQSIQAGPKLVSNALETNLEDLKTADNNGRNPFKKG